MLIVTWPRTAPPVIPDSEPAPHDDTLSDDMTPLDAREDSTVTLSGVVKVEC